MINGALLSVQQLFTQRIFRVPDYQRGYAWRSRQLGEFWDDLLSLEADRVHYTGLVMLEPVPKEVHQAWDSETWLIRDRGYDPLYVVDGQQRLTTIVILAEVIAKRIKDGERIASLTRDEIRQQYVQLGGDGLTRAFIFGYEKDDPSEEYLRTRIFGEASATDAGAETLYTRNLAGAKRFFEERLDTLTPEAVEEVFRKLTQWIRFNVYVAEDDLDASVIFETMNNRGKPLSTLELLKNRLIHLAHNLVSEDDRVALRADVNGAWKDVYGYLGRNAANPLDDETFLRAHFLSYFPNVHRSDSRLPYADELLKRRFTLERLRSGALTAGEIRSYALSLKVAARRWFLAQNPFFDQQGGHRERDMWLERIVRLGFAEFGPLLIALPLETPSDELVRSLSQIERFLFVVFRISRKRANTGRDILYRMAHETKAGSLSLDRLSSNLSGMTAGYLNVNQFELDVESWYDRPGHSSAIGFYAWPGLRYVLFEYENELHKQKKGHEPKLSWTELSERRDGLLSVEHVYPRNAKAGEWPENLEGCNREGRVALCHSLGNLIPLSIPKNSSLSNRSFAEKKDGTDEWPGYKYGSFSEIEVSQNDEWSADEILERGLTVLSFMERRWGVSFGDRDRKLKLLQVDFLER